ncbi:MAG: sigma 54-interacting transcriptional regulator [Deltaproteobacteria bacterium]|nr:sigma 54-interacting transcriptional regulator [Deltaproteobacteria bacterium]
MPLPRPPQGFTGQPATQVQSSTGALDLGFTERRCQLVVLSGTETGKAVEVNKPSFTVGKGEECDLVLTDPTVSRQHLVLEQQGGAVLVRDLQSTNGTWIDQFRIREAYLRPGIVLRAGQVQLRFESLFKPLDVAPSLDERFGQLIGRSLKMRQIFTMLERVAKTDATVVIFGETGCGKSAVAQAIHDASPRKSGPFVTVDCGAIAENLIESELFGHEKGAFTGATSLRRGALERANGGTLFIDELVDLRLDLQPRLLRVLEEREVRRVGGNEAIKLDVRIIAASRHDLWREVEAKRFREDLYFRLAVFTIPLPPLRERKEDIPMLAQAFARSIKDGDKLLSRFTPRVNERLMAHPFPGNVRELRNVIERASYLDGDLAEMLGPTVFPDGSVPAIALPNLAAIAGPSAVAATAASGAPPLAPTPAPFLAPAVPRTSPASMDDGTAPMPVAADGAVPLSADCTMQFKDAKEKLLEQFEAEYFRRLLTRVGGNASAMARIAGIDRKHLYTLAKKHNLDLKGKKDEE